MKTKNIFIAAFLTMLSLQSFADNKKINLNSTAVLVKSCYIETININFPEYDTAAGANNTAEGYVKLLCSKNIISSIYLTKGNSNDILNRYMLNGAERLNYNLYSNSHYGTIWTDGSYFRSDAAYLQYYATAQKDTYTIYAKVSNNQFRKPGSYSDTINISIAY